MPCPHMWKRSLSDVFVWAADRGRVRVSVMSWFTPGREGAALLPGWPTSTTVVWTWGVFSSLCKLKTSELILIIHIYTIHIFLHKIMYSHVNVYDRVWTPDGFWTSLNSVWLIKDRFWSYTVAVWRLRWYRSRMKKIMYLWPISIEFWHMNWNLRFIYLKLNLWLTAPRGAIPVN